MSRSLTEFGREEETADRVGGTEVCPLAAICLCPLMATKRRQCGRDRGIPAPTSYGLADRLQSEAPRVLWGRSCAPGMVRSGLRAGPLLSPTETLQQGV